MDNADIAEKNQAQLLNLKIKQQRQQHDEPQWIENGVVLCVDCGNPIPKARLEKVANAVRCTKCQNKKEKRESQYHV